MGLPIIEVDLSGRILSLDAFDWDVRGMSIAATGLEWNTGSLDSVVADVLGMTTW